MKIFEVDMKSWVRYRIITFIKTDFFLKQNYFRLERREQYYHLNNKKKVIMFKWQLTFGEYNIRNLQSQKEHNIHTDVATQDVKTYKT